MRRRSRWALWLPCLLLVGLLVDGALVAYGLRAELTQAAQGLRAGGAQLAGGSPDTAEREFTQALDSARSADDLTGRPSFVIASWLPWLGTNSIAVEALTGASNLSARAGFSAVRARREMGADAAAALYRDGHVRFGPLEQARPHLGDVERILSDAAFTVRAAPQPTIDSIADAVGTARSRLASASSSAQRIMLVAEALPALLGKDGSRRYLLAFQSPSEARGSGGFIGFYGELTAQDGRIRLAHVGPISELTGLEPSPSKINGPAWFLRRYRQLGALDEFQMVNQSPHFPAVAQALLSMYEGATGKKLDGVVAMDPVALGQLTNGTGPITGRDLPTEIGPANAAQVLLHDSYVEFGNDAKAQDRYLGSVVEAFWNRLNSGSIDLPALATSLQRAVATGHFKVYVRDSEVRSALQELHVDGGVTSYGPNLQVVYHNNLATNKVDYFLHRSISISVRIDASGAALVDTRVELENSAPEGAPSTLLGGSSFLGPGVNSMVLSWLMPAGGEARRVEIDGRHIAYPFREREAGFPQISEMFDIAPGESKTARITYRIPGAVSLESERTSFELTFLPHAAVRPDSFELTVVPPYGFDARTTFDGESQDGGLRASTVLDRPKTVELQLGRQ